MATAKTESAGSQECDRVRTSRRLKNAFVSGVFKAGSEDDMLYQQMSLTLVPSRNFGIQFLKSILVVLLNVFNYVLHCTFSVSYIYLLYCFRWQ